MDQSVLRLLAVHYRPLLPSDPLVSVQLSVPSLCQAAAVFGLGLLYQGSAHRHITNLLITELGRSLGGSTSSDAAGMNRKAGLIAPDSDTQQFVTNGPHTTSTSTSTGWTGAAGTGGFAGDSCELIALSAGLALGLVLLQVRLIALLKTSVMLQRLRLNEFTAVFLSHIVEYLHVNDE